VESERAADAASRLGDQMAKLNAQVAALSDHSIRPDAKRVAALIGGSDVPQPDRKDIEARSAQLRIVEAQRHQVAQDLAAVRDHLAHLGRQSEAARGDRDQAELALLTRLGEAYFEAYKRDAIAFVRSSVPPLHALANAIGAKNGEVPVWWGFIASILRIHWSERGANERLPDLVNVWPRHDETLVSGEAMSSFGGVAPLIAALREPAQ
jgi:hypothetical protein